MQSDQVSLILATGGGDLVKTAYSSGTPAIGVGPGNVPVYVSASADLSQAADDILQGKTYDNGIVCGSESNIIIDERVYEEFVEILKQKGALLISEKQHIDALFDDSTGRLHRTLIGVDAMTLAKQMDVDSPTPIKLILIAADPEQHAFLSREKMAPIVTLYKSEAGQGISLAAQLLWQEGAGHSAVIHSKDQDEIHQFASTLPAGRILVNMPATQGMLGISSDIPLSFMQGSGSWGGNISTEPVHWRHLVNIKRLTFKK
jgi:acetaldehyde dehydrogenase/alcohol dehydrogenase